MSFRPVMQAMVQWYLEGMAGLNAGNWCMLFCRWVLPWCTLRATTAPILDITVVSWLIKSFFESGKCPIHPSCPPITSSCKFDRTSLRNTSGTTIWIVGGWSSDGSNCLRRIPSWTRTWSQSWSSLCENLLALPTSSIWVCFQLPCYIAVGQS